MDITGTTFGDICIVPLATSMCSIDALCRFGIAARTRASAGTVKKSRSQRAGWTRCCS